MSDTKLPECIEELIGAGDALARLLRANRGDCEVCGMIAPCDACSAAETVIKSHLSAVAAVRAAFEPCDECGGDGRYPDPAGRAGVYHRCPNCRGSGRAGGF